MFFYLYVKGLIFKSKLASRRGTRRWKTGSNRFGRSCAPFRAKDFAVDRFATIVFAVRLIIFFFFLWEKVA